MEQPSRQRLRRAPPPPQHGDLEGNDRISALPDDMLLQVLVRLRCARTAARTGVLSRRWRGLWTCLPGLTFRDIPAGVIKSALARIARRTAVPLLEIRLMPSAEGKLDDARAKSLLCAAARLSPEEIIFVLPECPVNVIKRGRAVTMVLPCFHRATRIELDTQFLRIMLPPAGELPMLEMLTISGNIVDIGALLNRCPRLRVLRITFRGVEPTSLEAELTTLETATALGLTIFRLSIEFDDLNRRYSLDSARFASLLRLAAMLSPRELLFTTRFPRFGERRDVDLLCFSRTRSIEINLYDTRFTKLAAGEFSALERLALTGCTITDLVTMIIRCPRLRVLKVTADKPARDITVHSVSLEELDLDAYTYSECQSINIMTPLLKKLKLNVHGQTNIGVSISAPMVEKVSWWRWYTSLPLIFCSWRLKNMRLVTMESYKHKDEEDVCSQLPYVHVLSLSTEISSNNPSGVSVDFAHEMEKLLVANFSVFELHLNTNGHVFGAFVLNLLRMHCIRTNTRKLNIVLPCRFQRMPQASKCLRDCPCDEPKDWRSQSISLTRLEEVEIRNFRGGFHEADLVTSILEWAPMLTRMTVKVAYESEQSEIGDCAKTIYNICLAYPYVNCSVENWSGQRA